MHSACIRQRELVQARLVRTVSWFDMSLWIINIIINRLKVTFPLMKKLLASLATSIPGSTLQRPLRIHLDNGKRGSTVVAHGHYTDSQGVCAPCVREAPRRTWGVMGALNLVKMRVGLQWAAQCLLRSCAGSFVFRKNTKVYIKFYALYDYALRSWYICDCDWYVGIYLHQSLFL